MVPLPDGYDVRSFEPASADAATWDAYHAFRRIRHAERRPGEPPTPNAEAESWMRRPQPGEANRYWLVWRDGEVVGSAYADWVVEGPMLATNGHILWGGANVRADHRRRRIGTHLMRRIADVLVDQGRTVMTTGTEEDCGRAFLARLGASVKMESAENRLNLADVDWDMVAAWAAEGPRRSPDTRLVFWEHRVPESEFADYGAALGRLLNTMPFDDLDHGEIVITPEILRDGQARLDETGGSVHTMITREPDGTISGITDVGYSPGRPDRVDQQFTGVHPDHRGRGLGKWLKAAMLLDIRERYPDAKIVVTGNANSNDPMLGINRRLGFRTFKGHTSYQIDRDGLLKGLAALEA